MINSIQSYSSDKIVKSGGKELAHELEAKGYDWIKEEVGA